jgi:hypothetical protein
MFIRFANNIEDAGDIILKCLLVLFQVCRESDGGKSDTAGC